MKNNALTIESLSHSYDKTSKCSWILNSIDLKIQKGELLGLLGPSGCGKTTLLKLIAGFDKPKKGRILLHNTEISTNKKVTSPEKRNIGMVFQDYALFPHLNVVDNVKFGLRNKKDFSRVDYLLDVLGIEPFRNRYPHELSGGQKQRLAIARALAPGTSFLLLDEPFCSLDLNVRLRLRSELPSLLISCTASGLMVTHDPEEAMAICDKVAVMNDGIIHQCEAPNLLINNPKTLFVSSFILGNNIINIKNNMNFIYSFITNFNSGDFLNNPKIEYISISPNSISLSKSKEGKGTVISKEFLGEFFIYKIHIGGEQIRVKSELNNNLELGDKCKINLINNKEYYLFPGGYKKII